MKLIPALLFYFVLSLSPGAAPAKEKYERKSISYIDALWLATPEARDVKSDQVAVLLSAVKEQIEMPRFDYNPLPIPLIGGFVDAANAQPSLTIDALAALMQERLAPVILEILESSQQARAKELVDEAGRQGFLATKAKELGITIEEIEKVMNAAYIYMPVLTSLKREVHKPKAGNVDSGTKYTYTIEGGIIWFHVSMSGGRPAVQLKVAKSTKSKGYGADKFAFESAAQNFARNLQVATRDIAEFKLGTPIREADGRTVKFELGIHDGLRLDDTYLVGEWALSGGNRKFEYSGWVKVNRLADNRSNRTALSSAKAVKMSSLAPGMMLIEHPRLGIDIAVNAMLFHMKISKGRIPLIGGLSEGLMIVEPFDGMVFGFDVDAHANIAGITGKPQTFFSIGGNYAFPLLDTDISEIPAVISASSYYVWGLHVGFMRRIYIARTALSIGIKGGARFFTTVQDFYRSGDYTYTVHNNSIGVQPFMNLEYAATPDVNVGLTLGYRAFTISDSWSVELEGPSFKVATDLTADDSFPDIGHSGLAVGIYFHFTPPALPFDPFAWFKGAMMQGD